MLEEGKFPTLFFLRFQPVVSTMREDAWGDFGNTVTTVRLRVKFISQEEWSRRERVLQGKMCAMFFS
jgi:hypothetical protein